MAWADAVNRILSSSLSVFGEAVTYLPVTGGSRAMRGIYNELYVEVDPETGAMVSSQQPNLGVRLSDFPVRPKPGDRFTVRNVTYKLRDCQEDGEGGAKLILTKA